MKIGLLGHGVVGSGLAQIVSAGGTKALQQMEFTKILVKDRGECMDERFTLQADEIINDEEIEVICECMGGVEPAFTYVNTALSRGKYVVTSNKKMLATRLKELMETAEKHGTGIACEATTGGGIYWIASLARTNRVDRVTSFRGIFNGTTNYILSRMTDEQKEFADLLKKAQALGYAEQDPTDDVDGFDVRYKTVISCVHAFGVCPEVESVPVYGIGNIRQVDIAYAASIGKCIKLLGRGCYENDILSACVMPVLLNAGEPLAQVADNFNMIESYSPHLGRAAYMGQGAGSLPTAHAMAEDLADYLEGCEIKSAGIKKPHNDRTRITWTRADNSREEGFYYIRTNREEAFGGYIAKHLENGSFLTGKMTMTELADCVRAAGDETIFVAEVADRD